MIRSFRHRGLEELFLHGSTRGVNPQWKNRLILRLDRLDVAEKPEDMDVPGWRLHELRGDRAGTWAVNISGNWRLTFSFIEVEGSNPMVMDAVDVDLEDYH